MEHLVIWLSDLEWAKYREYQESQDSSIYSDCTSPYLQIHYVYGSAGSELMDEEDFQKFQARLLNI